MSIRGQRPKQSNPFANHSHAFGPGHADTVPNRRIIDVGDAHEAISEKQVDWWCLVVKSLHVAALAAPLGSVVCDDRDEGDGC